MGIVFLGFRCSNSAETETFLVMLLINAKIRNVKSLGIGTKVKKQKVNDPTFF